MSNEARKAPAFPRPQSELEERIGYRFENPDLLTEALTHSSYANEMRSKGKTVPYNERSEFLGDSVLSLIVSEYLYHTFREMPEGELTKLRANLVCEDTCWRLAQKISLGDYLHLGNGEERNGGRTRKSILADAFEAFLASLYLDGGKEVPQRFLIPFVTTEADRFKNKTTDYKTLLQQIIQQRHGEILEYVLIEESGPDHKKVFVTEARLNSNVIGRGKGASKREAEQHAAYQALILFGEKPEEE